ncbi:MAG: GTPase ObgE [Candidatus Dadabacteria bacterium]|nr:MAG: GTPase ObgE [Candidatus Dadabacteria bacterium]
MKFIDEAKIEVAAGKGGAGAVSFRREKFVPRGGPDGGDGGKGGSIILVADRNKHTLLDFRFKPVWQAKNGAPGEGRNKNGKNGGDLEIAVPVGTEIKDAHTGERVADLTANGQRVVLARGGRGGKGNAFFKSATNQTPRHAQPGEEGERGTYILSLKLVADVGLVGFPNAGKSTLLSRISKARPKIADYPFTTLEPNLGVAQSPDGRTFVVADIPGLIEGAHTGKGLGIKFLKHIERTKILLHLIDPDRIDESGRPCSVLDDFKTIMNELKSYSPELAKRPMLVALTKADTEADPGCREAVIEQLSSEGLEAINISAASGYGIDELLRRLADMLENAGESSM